MKTINNRSAEYPIEDIFLQRYSSRAMSGIPISKDEIMTLFEAARWSPSSMNAQPWRFVYAMSGTVEYDKLFSYIMDRNQVWAKNSSALILLVSKNNLDDGSFSIPHSFDAGAAWENIALQAASMKLVSHAIGGFDKKLTKESFGISDEYTVEIIIAIGRPGKIEDLPEALHAREKPSQRKNLEEIVFEGYFKN